MCQISCLYHQSHIFSHICRTNWVRLELKRPWSFSGVLSVLRRCSICYVARHRSPIQLCWNLTSYWGWRWSALPTRLWLILSGFKPASRLRTAVLVLGACLRSPFLSFWLRLRNYLYCVGWGVKLYSSPCPFGVGDGHRIAPSWDPGRLQSFRRFLLEELSAAVDGIRQWDARPPSFEAVFLGPSRYWEGSNQNSPQPFSEHRLTLLNCVTAGTGYWPCQLLHVAWC